DEEVAAADQVEARVGRVAGQVVPGEDAQLADALADVVVPFDPEEEAAQPFRRDVDLDVVHVDARAGLVQGGLVEVGGQDLDGERFGTAAQELEQGDGQRVDLLAGR